MGRVSGLVQWDILRWCVVGYTAVVVWTCSTPVAAQMLAGAARIDITNRDAGPVNDPLSARALVIQHQQTRMVLITVDAVAIGEIGPISNEYLPTVRRELQAQLGIPSEHVVINASHCHGIVCPDVAERTVQVVQQAVANLEPVRVGSGRGQENRIMENRRLKLKSGREADVRHAYSLPPDEEVVGAGPVDPEIGLLRFDRLNGEPLAVVYNFACHPILGVPSKANTADITGFSSQVIEENLGGNAVALFVQGCGGDINPVFYKDVDHPRDAEIPGSLLGLSTLRAVRAVTTQEDDRLVIHSRQVTLPRGDREERIAQLETQQRVLLSSLTGTSLNLKTFLPLAVKYHLAEDFPSYYSHGYFHEEAIGRSDLRHLDTENRDNMQQYIRNIETMEELTRLQTNLALLKRHQAELVASGSRTINVEVVGIRIGDFVLITFPGELTVRIGLDIKRRSPHPLTFVAGYTNGYIYYAPTTEQLLNVGGAQEDSDCILAPEWQPIFDQAVDDLLSQL